MKDKIGFAAVIAVVFVIGVATGITFDRIINPPYQPGQMKEVLDGFDQMNSKMEKTFEIQERQRKADEEKMPR